MRRLFTYVGQQRAAVVAEPRLRKVSMPKDLVKLVGIDQPEGHLGAGLSDSYQLTAMPTKGEKRVSRTIVQIPQRCRIGYCI